jgi:MFS family permease
MLAGTRHQIAELAAVAPRAYWYVWWGTLINRLGGFVVPLLTIYLIEVRKVSIAEAGSIVAVFGAGAIVASLTGGWMADRLGRKITMIISLFGGAIAMTVLGLARDLGAIAAMVAVVGFVGELYRPAVLAIVADVVPPSHRVLAYGLLHWVINIGFAVAVIVGGLLASVDFTILFLADAATMAIYGVIVIVAVPETRPAQVSREAGVPPSRAWFTDRVFVVLVAIFFALVLLPYQSTAPLGAHFASQGFSAAAFGGVMAVNGVLIVVAQPTLTTWVARFDPSHVMIVSAVCYGIGFSLHGLAASVLFHGVAVAVWTLGEICEAPARSSIVAAMAPADARGRYQGAIAMCYGGAAFVGPKLGTSVLEDEGPDALWLGCLVLGLAVAVALAVTTPARRRRMAVQ